MDVTDPGAVTEVPGRVVPQGSGFAVTFLTAGSGARTLAAFTDTQARGPAAIVAHKPRDSPPKNSGLSTLRQLSLSIAPIG